MREDKPARGTEPSAPGLWIEPGEMADSGSLLMSERPGEILKYPFCCLGLFSACGATVGACLGISPEDDDEDCSDCVEVLVRTERLARAAFVFSRAIAAIESLLCLAWWPAVEMWLSGSRDDVAVEDGGE